MSASGTSGAGRSTALRPGTDRSMSKLRSGMSATLELGIRLLVMPRLRN